MIIILMLSKINNEDIVIEENIVLIKNERYNKVTEKDEISKNLKEKGAM